MTSLIAALLNIEVNMKQRKVTWASPIIEYDLYEKDSRKILISRMSKLSTTTDSIAALTPDLADGRQRLVHHSIVPPKSGLVPKMSELEMEFDVRRQAHQPAHSEEQSYNESLWTEHFSKSRHKSYWRNEATGKSTWKCPLLVSSTEATTEEVADASSQQASTDAAVVMSESSDTVPEPVSADKEVGEEVETVESSSVVAEDSPIIQQQPQYRSNFECHPCQLPIEVVAVESASDAAVEESGRDACEESAHPDTDISDLLGIGSKRGGVSSCSFLLTRVLQSTETDMEVSIPQSPPTVKTASSTTSLVVLWGRQLLLLSLQLDELNIAPFQLAPLSSPRRKADRVFEPFLAPTSIPLHCISRADMKSATDAHLSRGSATSFHYFRLLVREQEGGAEGFLFFRSVYPNNPTVFLRHVARTISLR